MTTKPIPPEKVNLNDPAARARFEAALRERDGEKSTEKFKRAGKFTVEAAVYGGRKLSHHEGPIGGRGYSETTGYISRAEFSVTAQEGDDTLRTVKKLVCVGNISGIYAGDRIKVEFYACDQREPSSLGDQFVGPTYHGREIKDIERPSLVQKLSPSGSVLASFNLEG